MRLKTITVMTALSAMMLSGCGDSTVNNFNDLHPGISFESASKFLEKYAKENNCKQNPSKTAYWVTCKSRSNLDIENVPSSNIFDFTTYIHSDTKTHLIFIAEKSAQLTNKPDMDIAFDDLFSDAKNKHGSDGWSEQTAEPQSVEFGGKKTFLGLKSFRMTKTIKGNIKKTISKSIIYTSKGDVEFMVVDAEEKP